MSASPGPPSDPPGAGSAASPGAELEVLDLRILEEMGVVPSGGSGGVAREIVTLFLREERPRMERLARLMAERNAPDLAQAVHNLAGSSAILGARQVQAAAIALELSARAQSWPETTTHWARLQGAWARLERALAGFQHT